MSDREVRALKSFIEVLSAPLNFPDSSSWRREVNARARHLLDAPRAVFTLEWEETRAMEDEGLDPGAVPAYVSYYQLMDPGHRERRRRQRVVFSYGQELEEGWEIGPEELRNDFLAHYQLDRGVAMAHDVTPDVAGWCAFYPDSEPRERFDRRAIPILQLAYPAFRAGLETLFRTRGLRNEFTRLLDTVSDGFVLVGPEGRILHKNVALARMQHLDPQWDRVAQALDALLLRFRAGTPDAITTADLFQAYSVTTNRAAYEVIPTIPGPDLSHVGVTFLVQVRSRTCVFPSCEMLRDRFGLTIRETEVTRCLAEGMSYKGVAEHLLISIDTVRSHIRSIYFKLQVQSATEALSRILRLSE